MTHLDRRKATACSAGWVRRRAALGVVVALLAATSAGCDDELDLDDGAAWRTSTDPVLTSGFVWAEGSTVHLSDGSTIDTGEPVHTYVAAGDGVFFIPTRGAVDGTFAVTDLLFASPGAAATDTGLDVNAHDIHASPDGTHLVFLDTDWDRGSAVLRFFDLTEGTAYLSTDGMDPGFFDPRGNLFEAHLEIFGVDNEQVAAKAFQGKFFYDLATGEGHRVDDDSPGLPGHTFDSRSSPGGDWRIDYVEDGFDQIVDGDGELIPLHIGTARWDLLGWADEHTVFGTHLPGPGKSAYPLPGEESTLFSCRVPSGKCQDYPESTGRTLVFPQRPR